MSFGPDSRRAIRWYFALAVVAACSPDSSPTVTGVAASPATPAANVGGVPNASATAALAAVRAGNAQAIAAAPALVPPGVPLAPFIEATRYVESAEEMRQTA